MHLSTLTSLVNKRELPVRQIVSFTSTYLSSHWQTPIAVLHIELEAVQVSLSVQLVKMIGASVVIGIYIVVVSMVVCSVSISAVVVIITVVVALVTMATVTFVDDSVVSASIAVLVSVVTLMTASVVVSSATVVSVTCIQEVYKELSRIRLKYMFKVNHFTVTSFWVSC